MSPDDPSLPQGPLVTSAAGCLLWWPPTALGAVVMFPSQGGLGIAVSGAVLLVLRLAHVTARLAWGATASIVSGQRVGRSARSRRAAARSPNAARTAWS